MPPRPPPPKSQPRRRWRRWLLGFLVLLLLVLFLLSFSSQEVETTIDLQATPREVWAVLTDFPGYSAWHPYLKEITGTAAKDQTLTLKFIFPGQQHVVQATVREAIPNEELRLSGSWWLIRLLDGEEYYLLETQGVPRGTVRLRHGYRAWGLFVPFIRKDMDRFARHGLEEANAALKRRVEAKKKR
jgi:hypothetical protein